MTDSRQLAALIGPTLIALGVTEAINFHIFAASLAAVVYLNGAILFVAGLSIVRYHNRWTRDWSVLVTLTGWAALLLGFYRMVAPEAPQASEGPATFAMFAALAAIGCVMTFEAYRRIDRTMSTAA